MIPKFKYGGRLSHVAAAMLNQMQLSPNHPLNRWSTLSELEKLSWMDATLHVVKAQFPNTTFTDKLIRDQVRQANAHFLDNPLPEHNALETSSKEHNPTAKNNMSDRAVEFVTLVDGTNVKTLSKDQTIRAIKANLAVIKENTELNAQISSNTLAADIADRVAANEALKAHLESFSAPVAPPAA